MTTDDKPAPVHYGTLITACGFTGIKDLPGSMDVQKVTCPECLASPKTPIKYDTEQRPISVRHVSMNRDGSFTLAYEEGAMDPKKEADDRPAPVLYRYEIYSAEDAGERRHPQLVILEHFPDATEMEGHPIGDCWLFRAARREAPAYFAEVKRG
ncbi:MAG TPA: hypothetical protein VHG72_13970 [Polyangia bacterium]|nr:hypothetical protein [Polyangia bacterium]